MRLTRRTLLTSAIGSLAAPAARLARAEPSQLTLKLHHAFSAVSAPHEKFLAPWARNVEVVSDGRVRIELFPSMQLGGAPAQLLDQARDGGADIVWAAPTTQPGRFAKLEAFELPFLLSRHEKQSGRTSRNSSCRFVAAKSWIAFELTRARRDNRNGSSKTSRLAKRPG